MRNFIFKKNVAGGLIFELESYDFSLPTRTFDMPYNVGQLAIPEQYALGLFVSSSVLNMFQNGFFTVEDFDELKKKAEEIGLFGNIEARELYSVGDIYKALQENNSEVISNILNRKNSVEMNNLISIARDNLNSANSPISTANIRKIEEACGVELTIE